MLKPIHICWQHIFYPNHNNINNTNMAGYLIDHLPYLIAYTKLISLELNHSFRHIHKIACRNFISPVFTCAIMILPNGSSPRISFRDHKHDPGHSSLYMIPNFLFQVYTFFLKNTRISISRFLFTPSWEQVKIIQNALIP